MKDKIINILQKSFDVQEAKILDESELHKNHEEAKRSGGGHYSLLIVSKDFEGKNLLTRHKMIYQALQKEMKESIHALSINAMTPKEREEKG